MATSRLWFGMGVDYQRVQSELSSAVDCSAIVAFDAQRPSQIDYEARGTARPHFTADLEYSDCRHASGPVSLDLTVPDPTIFSLQQAIGRARSIVGRRRLDVLELVQELRVARDSAVMPATVPERWHGTWRHAYALGRSEPVPSVRIQRLLWLVSIMPRLVRRLQWSAELSCH